MLNEELSNRDLIDTKYFQKYNTFVMVFDKDVNQVKYNKMVRAIGKIFDFGSSFYSNVTGYRVNLRDNKFIYKIKRYSRDSFNYGWDEEHNFEYSLTNCVYPKLFTIDEVDSEDKIMTILLNGGLVAPSYAPRKIDRTLEASEFITRLPISVHCATNKDCLEFEDKLYRNGWVYLNNLTYVLRDRFSSINEVTFFDFNTVIKQCNVASGKKLDFDIKLLTYPTDKSEIDKQFGIRPSYAPRKIDRTLEGTTWYPYRFMTEEEMVEKHGRNWRSYVGWNDEGEMDYLLGMPYPYPYDKPVCVNLGVEQGFNPSEDEVWYIGRDMLIENKPIVPSYAPRKIDRTLEGVFTPKYRFKTKEEFEKEFGPSFRSRIGWNTVGNMDFLFGTPLLVDFDEEESNSNFTYRVRIPQGWSVSRRMIVPIKNDKPNYSPRKIDRTLENLNESVFMWFESNAQLNDSESPSRFKIDEKVKLKPNAIDIQRESFAKFESTVSDSDVRWFNDYQDRELVISELGHETDSNVWIAYVSKSDGHGRYVAFDALVSINKPNYTPRKIDRTLEKLNEGLNWFATNSSLNAYEFHQKFKIGDVVKLKSNIVDLQIEDFAKLEASVSEHDIKMFNEFKDKELIIKEFGHDNEKHVWVAYVALGENGRYITTRGLMSTEAPNYTPRKIDRTLEKFQNKYKFERIVVQVNYPAESERFQRLFFDNEIYWYSGNRQPLYLTEDFPDYLEVTLGDDNMVLHRPSISHGNTRPNLERWEDVSVDKHIYTIDEYDKVKSILEYGRPINEPTYKPRKIDRTLESMSDLHFTVVCENRKDCMEFEDFLHKLGYSYGSGSRYLLKEYPDIKEVTFKDFNEEDKLFDAIQGIQNYYNRIDYKTNKRQIEESFRKSPDYSPRKFNKTFEAFNLETSPYKSLAFKVGSEENLRKIVTLFYKLYNIENEHGLEWIIEDLKRIYRGNYDYQLLLILFTDKLFEMCEPGEVQRYSEDEYKTNKRVFTVNDLDLFNTVPTYEPRKINRDI